MNKYLSVVRQKLWSLHIVFKQSPAFGVLSLGLFSITLLFSPAPGSYYEAVKYPLAIVVLGACALVLRKQHFFAESRFLAWVSCLFLVWVAVACVLSPSPIVALVGFFPRYNSSLLLFAFFIAVIWVTLVVVRDKVLEWLVGSMLVVGGVAAVYAVLQSYGLANYSGVESLLNIVPERVASLLGNPNFSGLFLAVLLPYALVWLISRKSTFGVVGAGVVVFLNLWAMALFASRGAFLAAVVGVVPVLGWLVLRKRFWYVLSVLLFFGASVWLLSGYVSVYRGEAVSTLSKGQDESASQRFVAWDVSRMLLEEKPWFGNGLGSFQLYYLQNLPSARMVDGMYFDDAHNTLLHIATSVGIPGLLLFCVLFAYALSKTLVIVVFRKQGPLVAESWLVAAFGSVCGWLAGAFVNPVTVALYMLLAIALGILYGGFCERKDVVGSGITPVPQIPSRLLRFFGVACLIYGVLFVVGNQLFVYAIQKYDGGEREIGKKWALLSARIDPLSPLLQLGVVGVTVASGEEVEKARALLRHAGLQTWAQSPRIQLQLADMAGQLYAQTGVEQDKQNVEAHLAKARSLSAVYPNVYVQSAYYAALYNNPSDALLYARTGVIIQPKNYLAWLVLAKAYQQNDQLSGMVFSLERAASIRPNDPLLVALIKRLKKEGSVNAIQLLPQKGFSLSSLP